MRLDLTRAHHLAVIDGHAYFGELDSPHHTDVVEILAVLMREASAQGLAPSLVLGEA